MPEPHAVSRRRPFIILFRLSEDGQSGSGFVIHLVGLQLARILKRLRRAEADRRLDINHAEISFDYRKVGKPFALAPTELRRALEDELGPSRSAYVTGKNRQLQELGYETGRYEGEALVKLESAEHLRDIMLGLAPLKPVRLQTFDTRFGIRIPSSAVPPFHADQIFLSLPEIGSSTISIRGAIFSKPAIFEATASIGPPIPPIGGPHLVMRHVDFTLLYSGKSLDFKTVDGVAGTRRPLDRWVPLARALSYLSRGNANLTFEVHVPDFPRFSVDWPTPSPGPYSDRMPEIARFLERWQAALQAATVVSRNDFDIDEALRSREAALAACLLAADGREAYFELAPFDTAPPTDAFEALFCNSASMAGASISYAVRVTFRRTGHPTWPYRSCTFEALDIRPAVDELAAYRTEMAMSHGLSINLDPE